VSSEKLLSKGAGRPIQQLSKSKEGFEAIPQVPCEELPCAYAGSCTTPFHINMAIHFEESQHFEFKALLHAATTNEKSKISAIPAQVNLLI
jgi:hypothetical protein